MDMCSANDSERAILKLIFLGGGMGCLGGRGGGCLGGGGFEWGEESKGTNALQSFRLKIIS